GLVRVGAGQARLGPAADDVDPVADRDGARAVARGSHRLLADPAVARGLVHLRRAEDPERRLAPEREDAIGEDGGGETAAGVGAGSGIRTSQRSVTGSYTSTVATASALAPKPPMTKIRPSSAAAATSWRAVGIGASGVHVPGLRMSSGAEVSVVLPRQAARA